MGKGWYKKDTSIGIYYTASIEQKVVYRPIGDGEYEPSPGEIADALNARPQANIEAGGRIISETESHIPKTPSIDLPPGCYSHAPASHMSGDPERLIPLDLREDAYLILPSVYKPISEEIKAFIDGEQIYRDIGSIYKRGILLYGPPGTGKTSLIRSILTREIPPAGVTIFFDSIPSTEFIKALKTTLSDVLKVFVFEELVSLVENTRVERVLDFLDGEKSVDKTLLFATTNYPEKLPGNIVDRPSRWDRVIKIGTPTAEERSILLTHYLRRSVVPEDIKVTKDLSAAAIKEVCILTFLRKCSLTEAVKSQKDHSELVKKDFAKPNKMGIGSHYDDDFDL